MSKAIAIKIYRFMVKKGMVFIFVGNKLVTREDCLKVINREDSND